MARVLREGPVIRRTCSGCGSLCEFEYSDLYIDDTGHGSDHVVCPICRSVLVIKPDDWPGGWKTLYAKEEGAH